jgi:hypothetical protein
LYVQLLQLLTCKVNAIIGTHLNSLTIFGSIADKMAKAKTAIHTFPLLKAKTGT